MSLTRIQRINIDSTDFKFNNSNVSLLVSLPNPIVKVPSEYNVVVEKAEIPISRIPLNVIREPYTIMIDYPPSMPDHPVLEKKLNVFTFSGAYYTVSEFLGMVNKIINDDLQPGVSCGGFSLNSDLRIEYKFGDPTQRSGMAAGITVWFDSRLKYLLDGIPGLFSATPDTSLSSTLEMYELDWAGYLGAVSGVVLKPQAEYLLPRLFGFKSIRIFSDLPTTPYAIYDPVTSKTKYSDLLTEIMMDSQNYVQGRTNQLYIPQNYVFSELNGVTELKSFKVWFRIHYKNGYDHPLEVEPSEYVSLTLSFHKIINQ